VTYFLRRLVEQMLAIEKAMEVIKDRGEVYGHPANVHAKVARLWSAYLGTDIEAKDVALMMLLFKLGREMNSHNEDNVVDAHGYLSAYERILRREAGEDD
jgi:hypothetical protein